MSNAKVKERKEARRLRREAGLSIPAIAARLGVSKSSAYTWTRDIPLTPAQQEALLKSVRRATHEGRARGNAVVAARAKAKRLDAQLHGRRMARENNPLHLAGCMLYWAEGSKVRNTVQFTNSDPDMVAQFVRFLRECYAVRSSESSSRSTST